MIGGSGVNNPYLEQTEWNAMIDPVGLRIALNDIYDRYHLPMMIVENGIGVSEELTSEGMVHDQYRIDYLQKHIIEMESIRGRGSIYLAIRFGVQWTSLVPLQVK